jgi:hypothetical protein
MAPYFEGEQRLGANEIREIGEGLQKAQVRVLNDDSIAVFPSEGDIYTGDSNPDGGAFKNVRPISGSFRLIRHSVSTSPAKPEIVWKKP